MNEKTRLLKEEAQLALSRGEWSKALRHLQEYCVEDPADLRSRLKMADVLERLGRKEEAVRELRKLADDFAEAGFLLQAVSVNKIILRLDPSQKDVNQRLAHRYTERVQETKVALPFPPIPLFSGLNEQELQALVSEVHVRAFQKDDAICHEGDAGDSLMAISRGEVGVFKRFEGGEDRWICNLREGDLFGEFGFFTDQKRHATVKAGPNARFSRSSGPRSTTSSGPIPPFERCSPVFSKNGCSTSSSVLHRSSPRSPVRKGRRSSNGFVSKTCRERPLSFRVESLPARFT